jgi:hypothetical protein
VQVNAPSHGAGAAFRGNRSISRMEERTFACGAIRLSIPGDPQRAPDATLKCVMPDTLTVISQATARERLLLALRHDYDGQVDPAASKIGAIEAVSRALAAAGVSYALIGGVAVGIRSGVPRATLDVDFAVSSGADRASLIERMAWHGIRLRGQFAHSLNFVHDSGEPVQLAFDPVFDAMIERAEPLRFGELEVRVVTTEDLIAMKRRAAADPAKRRSKALRDQADIALLEGDVPGPNEGW